MGEIVFVEWSICVRVRVRTVVVKLQRNLLGSITSIYCLKKNMFDIQKTSSVSN